MHILKSRLISLLRWSERYTKIDMVYLFKGGTLLTGSDAVLSIVSLGVSMLIAAFVPKETFGIYRYVIAVAAVAAALSLSGMNNAVTRAVALGREGSFARSLPLQARFALLQAMALASVAGYYFFMGNASYGIALTVVAILAPASGVLNTYTAYLAGKKDFGRLAWWKAQGGILQAAALTAAIFTTPTVLGLVIAYFLTSLAANALFTWRIFRKLKPNREYEPSDMTYGKHLSVMNAANVIATQFDALLIYHLLGPVSLAIYSFAILIPDRLRSFTSFLPNVALPKLAARSARDLRASMGRRLLIATTGTATVAAVYAVASPLFFSIFFPQYLESVPYTQFASLFILAVVPVYLETILTAQGSYKKLYIVSLATPFVKIMLSITAIVLFGIAGAIGARIVAGLFSGALSLVLVRRTR